MIDKISNTDEQKVNIVELLEAEKELQESVIQEFVAVPETGSKGLNDKLSIAFKRLFRKGTFYIFEQFASLVRNFESKILNLMGLLIKDISILSGYLSKSEQQYQEYRAQFLDFSKRLAEANTSLEKQETKMAELQNILNKQSELLARQQAYMEQQNIKLAELNMVFDKKIMAQQDCLNDNQKQIWKCNEWLQQLKEDTRLDSKQIALIYAYRYLLNREPENTQIVTNNLKDWRELRKDIRNSEEYKHITFRPDYYDMPYHSLVVDGIYYFFNKEDVNIPDRMIKTGKNWAEDDIKNFIRIADQYYYASEEPADGLFLDIGGNIGTTSIYCKKKIKQHLNYIAFEPIAELVKLFNLNIVCNGLSDIVVEHLALSNQPNTMLSMTINYQNWGNSQILQDGEKKEDEVVPSTTLDDYLENHSIDYGSIKYMWLDVEGFEPEVLEGAAKFFDEYKAPLCLEFNQDFYKEHNSYEKMLLMLKQYFNQFVVCQNIANRGDVLRAIDDLELLWEEFEYKPCDLILF